MSLPSVRKASVLILSIKLKTRAKPELAKAQWSTILGRLF
ncbi:cleavage and polyadenylation specificity factor 3, isoform CRA_c [Rattus norvegicus]|uniref:Cleavage and polyadenylation specificity factor 3, isoform CRA_c n=1 Tax=Rattus norvegicus TaxID=10116 RepID=A6HAW1_RAT|nr:cleavage and polyadenylation specificity factor 3, isoform CRA_c [Rattus norvegicus]